MLTVFKRWFGQGESRRQVAPVRRTSTDFRPDLIPVLQTEHKELLALFAEIESASERGDEIACRTALDAFTRLLQDHLLTENRHLYGYFSRHPDPLPDQARRIEDMSADMLRIGKMLHHFITTYTRVTWSELLMTQLRRDLRPIGDVLAHRIHEEEAVLYPLYAPRTT